MPSQVQVHKRREKISLVLAKSITNPTTIAEMTKINLTTVKNDLKWMKQNSKVWLTGHALDGYVFSTQNTIAQLKDIEVQLQTLRNKEKDLDNLLKIIKELKDVINMRWVIEGDGPALMAQKYADEHPSTSYD